MKPHTIVIVALVALLPLTVLAESSADVPDAIPLSEECLQLKAELDRLTAIRDEELKSAAEIRRTSTLLVAVQPMMIVFTLTDERYLPIVSKFNKDMQNIMNQKLDEHIQAVADLRYQYPDAHDTWSSDCRREKL
jgi:hypothetical protein